MNVTGITYLMLIFCTGSMTGDDSLCPMNTLTPFTREAVYLMPNEPLIRGEVYFYESEALHLPQPFPYRFIVHRMIEPIDLQNQMYRFKGDSNEYSEGIQRQYVKLRLI